MCVCVCVMIYIYSIINIKIIFITVFIELVYINYMFKEVISHLLFDLSISTSHHVGEILGWASQM